MGAIADSIIAARSRKCLAAQWFGELDEDDQAELAEYAVQHPASAFNIVREHGFRHSRTVWTAHFKDQCTCGKGESK